VLEDVTGNQAIEAADLATEVLASRELFDVCLNDAIQTCSRPLRVDGVVLDPDHLETGKVVLERGTDGPRGAAEVENAPSARGNVSPHVRP
jgi:hypothetical protein